ENPPQRRPAPASSTMLRRRALIVNLLTVLQMQLRTCAAGPQQLYVVRLALQDLDPDVQMQPLDSTGSAASVCEDISRDDCVVGVSGLGRYADWLAAALTLYGTAGGGAAARTTGAADVVALLPSVVLGQTYRTWVPDISPQVAVVLHDACTAIAVARVGATNINTSSNSSLSTATGAAVHHISQRCMARLHFPLGCDVVGGLPHHVPYCGDAASGGAGWRCRRPSRRVIASHVRHSPSSLLLARQYPDMRNLPVLPSLPSPAPPSPPLLPGQSAVQSPLVDFGRDRSPSSTPGTLVRHLVSHLVPTAGNFPGATNIGLSGGFNTTKGSAADHASAYGNETLDGRHRSGPPPPQRPSPPTQELLLPPGSQPRTLLLRGAAIVALVSELVSYCPPDSLRPEELWVLHVADRDAGLSRELHAAAAEDIQPHGTVPSSSKSYSTGRLTAASVLEAWDAWMKVACDAQLAADVSLWIRDPPQLSDLDSARQHCAAHRSNPAPPLISIPINAPPATPRPSLPPICRLELLVRQGCYGPVQSLLALMWQGDWFRGDVASMARFSAEELLHVMCVIVHLKEMEELAEADLGWLSSDAAAQQVLQLLAAPSLEEVLSSPAVRWALRPIGPYAPSDLAQEKRIRSQKLLDAAVGLDEYFDRAQQALQYVAEVGQSGLLSSGRLDPYRPLRSQGESVAAFLGTQWLADAKGRIDTDGGDSRAKQEEQDAQRRQQIRAGGLEEGVSIGGLRARRPQDAVKKWEGLLGVTGVRRLRSALQGMGYDPDKWMSRRR
ncbi:hypothetical protein Vafri_11020, partial [Volvox africanus]